MYDFLSGPMLVISLAVFVIGLAARVVLYVKGLNWQLDRVPYGYWREYGIKWAIKSIVFWVIPFGSRSWREKPLFATATFLFHIGLVVVPLFLFAHVMLLEQTLGISWPTMPSGLADALTILAMIAGVFMVMRRVALPEVRIITTAHDWFILGLSIGTLLTGFISAHQDQGTGWLIMHLLLGNGVLLLAPFTKLSHIVLFFCSRAQLGMDYGIKRGGMKGRGIAW